MWIFNKKIDLTFIFFPMLGIPLFFLFFNELNNFTLIFFLIMIQLLDVGHVYTTVWMTIFDKKELSSNKIRYILYPILIGIIFFLWIYLKIPFFWSFIAYFTIYHNIKQGYGIQRWYQKKHDRYCKESNYLFYLMTSLPVLIAHFRDNLNISFYTEKDDMIFKYIGEDFFFAGIQFDNLPIFFLYIIYFLIIAYFITTEGVRFNKTNKLETTRFLYILAFSFMYGISFIYFKHIIHIASAIIISHALLYIYILYKKLPEMYPKKFNRKNVLFFLVLTILAGSGLNYYIQENLIEVSYYYLNKSNILEIIFTLLYVIPTICHFIWDASIWKSNHRFSKKIYN